MDFLIIDRILSSLLTYKQNLRSHFGHPVTLSLSFIWHGGEPLLIGTARFNEILSIQDKYEKQGLLIDNYVKTNGTLINEDYIRIFQDHHIHICVRIDGPEPIHDAHRIHKNGTRSFHETMHGISLLQAHKFTWSAISVITSESLGHEKEIHDFFCAQKPGDVEFSPFFSCDPSPSLSISPEQYASFMVRLFDLWVAEPGPVYDVRLFSDILCRPGWKNPVCTDTGRRQRTISISSNGDLYSCTCLPSIPFRFIGNILDKPFDALLADAPSAWNRSSVCSDECCHPRLQGDAGQPIPGSYCEARNVIICHIKNRTATR